MLSFICLLAILNRLPTADKMRAWGLNISPVCKLCGQEDESRSHLFIMCSFSKQVWKQVLMLCGIMRNVQDWNYELFWAVKNSKGKTLSARILQSAWCAFIYEIWRERNAWVHSGIASGSEVNLEKKLNLMLNSDVRIRNITCNDVNRGLLENWGLHENIFDRWVKMYRRYKVILSKLSLL